jgi:hypothetical protein
VRDPYSFSFTPEPYEPFSFSFSTTRAAYSFTFKPVPFPSYSFSFKTTRPPYSFTFTPVADVNDSIPSNREVNDVEFEQEFSALDEMRKNAFQYLTKDLLKEVSGNMTALTHGRDFFCSAEWMLIAAGLVNYLSIIKAEMLNYEKYGFVSTAEEFKDLFKLDYVRLKIGACYGINVVKLIEFFDLNTYEPLEGLEDGGSGSIYGGIFTTQYNNVFV